MHGYDYTYHPLRYVAITDAIEDSTTGSFSIDLELRGFPQYKAEDETNQAMLNTFNDFILEHENRPTSGNDAPKDIYKKFVVQAHRTVPLSYSREGWLNLVKHLGSTEEMRKCVFYRLARGKDSDIKALEPRYEDSFEKGIPRLTINSGETRRLALQVYHGSAHRIREPRVTIGDLGVVHGPFVRQASDTLIFEYYMDAPRSLSAQTGTLALLSRTEDASDTTAEGIVGPERHSLIDVKPNHFLKWTTILLLAGGSAAPNIFDSRWVPYLGALAIGLGIFLVFEKFPIKSV